MSETTPVSPGGESAAESPPARYDFSPETFWEVVRRRSKYAAAIGLSALVFCTLGWAVAGPRPMLGGVSLMPFWSGHGLLAALALAGLLVAMTAISSLLVHPDSPHMGLACALMGLAGMSIRGGTIETMVRYGQQGWDGLTYEAASQSLAVECVQWAVIFLIAEVFARLFHDRFLANTHWVTRSGPELTRDAVGRTQPGLAVVGMSLVVSKALRTHNMRRRVATPLAVLYSGVLAFVLLAILLQSQQKGQVLMACFLAFFGATLGSYLAFPRVPILALMLAVPLTAAVGYLYGMHMKGIYPGQAGFFAMRALPIDYITGGVPGAILGYYGAFHWSLHSQEES